MIQSPLLSIVRDSGVIPTRVISMLIRRSFVSMRQMNGNILDESFGDPLLLLLLLLLLRLIDGLVVNMYDSY
jgi:hypothetical protein